MTDNTPAQPSGDPGKATSGQPDSGAPQPTPAKKRTWLWVALGVAAVLLIGVAYVAAQPVESTPSWLLFLKGGVSVPQVIGMEQADAENAITGAELKVGQISEVATLAVAPGIVVAQSPAASTKVEAQSSVDMSVSIVPTAEVPNVVGQSESQASATLAEQGLPTGAITYVYDSAVKPGYVKSQDPVAGTETKVGTTVALTVSKGQQTGKVPNVVGLSESDANDTLDAAGFKITTTKASSLDAAAGVVMSQSPAAGATANTGSTVAITVSKGAPAQPSEPAPTPEPTSTPEPPATSGTVSVPDVIGLGPLKAIAALNDAKLQFTITFVKSTDNFLKVASQDPKAGTEVDPGTSVTLGIGLPGFLFGHEGELPSPPESGAPTVTPTPLPSNPSSGPSSSVTTP